MPSWVIIVILIGVAWTGFALLSASTKKTSFRLTVTGQVTAVRNESVPLTTGVRHYFVVVVRTDDEHTVELRDPPYRNVRVGDRIVEGQLVTRAAPERPADPGAQ
jgi:hypothetical protein